MVRSLASAWLATAMISSMRTGFRASGRHMSVTIEKPSTFIPAWTAVSTSGIGRHADDVGADRPEEPVLGPGLQVRAGHRHVDPAMGDDVRLERDAQGQVLQLPVVGLDHVGEPGAEAVVVGADQRVDAQQVDVVLDDHQIALGVLRVQPAAGVGDDQQLAAQLLHHPDRERHLGGRVAFVEVEPAFHRDHRAARPARRRRAGPCGPRPSTAGSGGSRDRGSSTADSISRASAPRPVPSTRPTLGLPRQADRTVRVAS